MISVLCPVSVLSHSVESCGTSLTRPGIVFHRLINLWNLKKKFKQWNLVPQTYFQMSGQEIKYESKNYKITKKENANYKTSNKIILVKPNVYQCTIFFCFLIKLYFLLYHNYTSQFERNARFKLKEFKLQPWSQLFQEDFLI